VRLERTPRVQRPMLHAEVPPAADVVLRVRDRAPRLVSQARFYLVIKMNTGGGKTIVGLLIARSCLNEEAGPVAYLVPDNYLVDQVCNEAGRLGIDTTTDPRAFAYSSGRALLVVVFQRLFNGQSLFGISGSAGRAPPDQGLGPRSSTTPTPAWPKPSRSSASPCHRVKPPMARSSSSSQTWRAVPDRAHGPTYQADQGRAAVPFWAWADRQRSPTCTRSATGSLHVLLAAAG
jgi:hypothetical protein